MCTGERGETEHLESVVDGVLERVREDLRDQEEEADQHEELAARRREVEERGRERDDDRTPGNCPRLPVPTEMKARSG